MSGSGHSVARAAESDTAYFAFGRFQPPTIGHELLFQYMDGLQGDRYVFASRSRDSKKNPLDVYDKVRFMRKMFEAKQPGVRIVNTAECGADGCANLQNAFMYLLNKGYTRIFIVAGSDRVESFTSMILFLKRKLGDEVAGRITIGVEMAGSVRDEESAGLEGMSGTKMRAAALEGDIEGFSAGVRIGDMTEEDIGDLMGLVVEGLTRAAGVKSGRAGRRGQRRRGTKCRAGEYGYDAAAGVVADAGVPSKPAEAEEGADVATGGFPEGYGPFSDGIAITH